MAGVEAKASFIFSGRRAEMFCPWAAAAETKVMVGIGLGGTRKPVHILENSLEPSGWESA